MAGGMSPISSRKSGPPLGGFEQALPVRVGPGEGPPDVAEEFAFEERLRDRPATDDDERAFGPLAPAVQGAGDQLLARAGLPVDQDGAGRGGGSLNGPEDLLHPGAPPHELLKPVIPLHLLPQAAVLIDQSLLLHGPAYDVPDLVQFEGFGQVVAGPELHGLDRGLDRGVARDDHHEGLRRGPPDRVEDDHPVRAGHPQVHKGQVEQGRADLLQGGPAVPGGIDLVPLLLEGLHQAEAQVRLVVHDQDARLFLLLHFPSPLTGSATVKTAPPSGRFPAAMRPPCAWTMP